MNIFKLIYAAALMTLLLVTSGCGRNEQSPSVAPHVRGTGQQSVATPTLREDFVWETEVAIAVATEQVATAPPLPPATFPPPPTFVPEAVNTDCGPLDDFIPRNCWQSEQRGIAIQAGLRVTNPHQGAVQFFAAWMKIYDTPAQVGAVKLRAVDYPYAYVFTGTLEYTFNLQTQQWWAINGTPIPTTPTATPTGPWLHSVTLFNADTDQPMAVHDPLLSGAKLSFAMLGTRNLNIRANTVSSTVGSVTFKLDGTLIRTESGAPYALAGNNGADYYAWTPSLGLHTLVVTPYSGSGATGTVGKALTIKLNVVEGTAATVTATRANGRAPTAHPLQVHPPPHP